MQDLGIRVLIEGNNLYRLMGGLLVTVKIALISVIIFIIFGIPFGIVMTSKNKLLRLVCRAYLEAVRIIPVMVWLFIFYFGVPKLTGIHIAGDVVSVIVFSIWGTAEMGDLVRGAVTSLPKHQKESGKAIGLTNLQIYSYIIIPQSIRRLLPGTINLVTRMIKTTSLVVLIGVVEVLKVGQQVIESFVLQSPSASFWVYGFIFFLYFIICYPISLFARKLELRWKE
ncbi:MAG: amino acid ABC transporter permease [Caldicoprobacter sp.]|uniref:amino acid ABC transporter permease n=1 Tax=Caldicoprobacter sp. TaxID=2004500 RepID=UPI0039C4154A